MVTVDSQSCCVWLEAAGSHVRLAHVGRWGFVM